MELREHPLLSYYGLAIWPPKWSPIAQPRDKAILGEVGILKRVSYSSMSGYCCHLYIDYNELDYMGTLLIDDAAFCRHLYFVLHHHLNISIKEIGSLDMSYTL